MDFGRECVSSQRSTCWTFSGAVSKLFSWRTDLQWILLSSRDVLSGWDVPSFSWGMPCNICSTRCRRWQWDCAPLHCAFWIPPFVGPHKDVSESCFIHFIFSCGEDLQTFIVAEYSHPGWLQNMVLSIPLHFFLCTALWVLQSSFF